MAIKDSLNNVRDNLSDVIAVTPRNFKQSLSTDQIKSGISLNSNTNEFGTISRDDKIKGDYSTKQDFQFITSTILEEENNNFYNANIRSGIFKTIIDQLVAKVTSNLDMGKIEAQLRTSFNGDIFGGNLNITEKNIIDITQQLILYDETYVKLNINEDGNVDLIIVKPFAICKFKNGLGHIYFKGGNSYVEKRYEIGGNYFIETLMKKTNTRDNFKSITTETLLFKDILFYNISAEINLTTKALLEQILLYSELNSIIQKEIRNGESQQFIDKQYINKYLRSNMIPVNSPDILNSDGNSKPIFEFVQPNLRSTELKQMKDLIKEEIASLYKIDKGILGLDSSNDTTIASRQKTNTTIESINRLRVIIQDSINRFLIEVTNNSNNMIDFGKYVSTDVTDITNNNAVAINSNQATIKTVVEQRNPTWSNEKIEIEYLTIMYQRGIAFTKKEEELAIKYGVLANPNFE